MIAEFVVIGIELVIAITLLFFYRISLPLKFLIGVAVVAITWLFMPREFADVWDWVVIIAWALVSLLALTPYHMRRTVTHYDDGDEVKIFTNKTDWRRGRIYSVLGFINALFLPIGNEKVLGHILPINSNQSIYNRRKIKINEIMARGATIITGAIGSGKTQTLLSLIRQDLRHKPVIFADYKGGTEVIAKLKKIATRTIVVASSGVDDVKFDPFAGMNESAIVEVFMNMRKWSENGNDAHFKLGLNSYLTFIIPIVLQEHKRSGRSFVTLLALYLQKNPPKPDQRDAYSTLSNTLNTMLRSSFSKLFDESTGEEFKISDLKAGDVLILSFNSSNKEVGTLITSFFLNNLMLVAIETLIFQKSGLGLYIDEFASMTDKYVIKDIIEKGREPGIETTLSFQDINQIAESTNENYAASLFGTVNTFIPHAGLTAESSKYYSGVISSSDLFDQMLINLVKPYRGKPPTAMFITRYGSVKLKRGSEMWLFIPALYSPKLSGRSSISEPGRGKSPGMAAAIEKAEADGATIIEMPEDEYNALHNQGRNLPHADEDRFEPIRPSDLDKLL